MIPNMSPLTTLSRYDPAYFSKVNVWLNDFTTKSVPEMNAIIDAMNEMGLDSALPTFSANIDSFNTNYESFGQSMLGFNVDYADFSTKYDSFLVLHDAALDAMDVVTLYHDALVNFGTQAQFATFAMEVVGTVNEANNRKSFTMVSGFNYYSGNGVSIRDDTDIIIEDGAMWTIME